MRPVLHGDLAAAARALLTFPSEARGVEMQRMLRAAELADRYRRRRGRAHPYFGSGSLMAAAGRWTQCPEPFLDDPDYLECLYHVISALRGRKQREDVRALAGPGPD